MFVMGPQVCTASLLRKKHHHHQHMEAKQSDPSKVDDLLASQAEEAQDPDGWGPMDRSTLDAEFPDHAPGTDEGAHPTGIYDFRAGHFAILDTPQKMDPEWQAEQHLSAVNALSGRREGVLKNDADDDTDDD